MRTTLTIDDDVMRLLQELARERNERFKDVVNEVLRGGLAALRARPSGRRSPYRTEAVSLGRPALPDLDNIAEVLAVAEGEDFR